LKKHLLNKYGGHGGAVPAVLLALLILMSAGCSDSRTASDPATDKTKTASQPISTKPTGTAATVAEPAPAHVYSYVPGERRDPFMSIVTREEGQMNNKLSDRPPLERFNIAAFTLTGIIWGGFDYNAMLEGPNGKGYFVRVGTVIGPDRSVIKRITPDTMVIEERFKNYMGVEERREIIVNLRKRQEGTQ